MESVSDAAAQDPAFVVWIVDGGLDHFHLGEKWVMELFVMRCRNNKITVHCEVWLMKFFCFLFPYDAKARVVFFPYGTAHRRMARNDTKTNKLLLSLQLLGCSASSNSRKLSQYILIRSLT